MNKVLLTFALSGLLYGCAAPTSKLDPAVAKAGAAPALWEPANETFRGCEGACGARTTSKSRDVAIQPGAHLGQRAYCPVSGVVFTVKEPGPRREMDGKPIYFCCEACAAYFSANSASLISLRRLSGSFGQ